MAPLRLDAAARAKSRAARWLLVAGTLAAVGLSACGDGDKARDRPGAQAPPAGPRAERTGGQASPQAPGSPRAGADGSQAGGASESGTGAGSAAGGSGSGTRAGRSGCKFVAPPGRLAVGTFPLATSGGTTCSQAKRVAQTAAVGQPAGANLALHRDGFSCTPSSRAKGANVTYTGPPGPRLPPLSTSPHGTRLRPRPRPRARGDRLSQRVDQTVSTPSGKPSACFAA
jgi:hypothetical protein